MLIKETKKFEYRLLRSHINQLTNSIQNNSIMEETQISTVMSTVTETHDQVMKLSVTVNSLIARLEAFEKMYTSNNVAPKRVIKVAPVASTQDLDETASVSSTGSKRKPVATPVVPVVGTEEKIINALTFFKKLVMFKNYDNLRTKYSTPEMVNTAKVGIKKPEGTEAYWISVGNAIWKLLDKDQKKDVREDFNKWKKIHQVASDVSQLNEDDEDSS